MRLKLAIALSLSLAAAAAMSPRAQEAAADPPPGTIDEFKTAVQQVLDETGVPGAGIALVRLGGVEWAGGVGYADRDAKTLVNADTHFRAGSISKTFVASALVQMYEDGEIDLNAPVAELAPDVRIDNAWMIDEPVRVIHLLEHTAGFDDMHFNELYNLSHPADMPLAEVLKLNPASRVVRWRPGTRMSYSNPGYAVAGYVIEKVSGQKFEDRIAQEIFKPVGMSNSSFYLTAADHAVLAKGYQDRNGPPVPYSQIYLRPAGNLHTTPADLGKFVQVLLNWGELPDELVIDPEYLSNMEHPRTTLASRAGLRSGYGTGLATSFVGGYPMLGHNGGIEGFLSAFAYSTTRDVGFVVLLNSTHSPEALRRISELAVRYLKRDVEPPPRPEETIPESVLRTYEGYYHPANPRNQAMAFVTWLTGGLSVEASGNRLTISPVFGQASTLVPVSDTLFRFEQDPEPSRVFAADEDGVMVLTGGSAYAERTSRARVESVRWPVLIAGVLMVTPLLMIVPWLVHARRAQPHGFFWLKCWLVLGAIGLLLPPIALMAISD
ncbi:MAG TPA: serine hydrolase domain-containing protein, partial [Vicinamibacterales bacterium]|nr:serine hydrolase domain-containing protein [Vicinamibacterales bacterium]